MKLKHEKRPNIDELLARMSRLESRLDYVEEEQESFEVKLSDHEDAVASLGERIDAYSEEVEGLTECVSEVNSSVTDLLDRLDVPDTEEE